jgi:hypothetical protein
LLAVLAFFTIAATKLPSYWLPATPAAALLILLAGGGGPAAPAMATGVQEVGARVAGHPEPGIPVLGGPGPGGAALGGSRPRVARDRALKRAWIEMSDYAEAEMTRLADTQPDSSMLLLDRLLASPRHAERLAAWWLDLVRYADTVGYHGDQDHSISPYRDWVIKAFLDNIPFDRLTVLQLAGDLVGPAGSEHTDDPVLASAYNRLLQTTHEGGLQLKEYRAIYQADRIRNVSGVWMGATVGCAQCHDHKYDPYTAKDFHALGAFFADIDDERHMAKGGFGGQNLNALPTIRDPEITLIGTFDRDRAADLDARIHSLQNELPPLVLPPRAQLAISVSLLLLSCSSGSGV